MYNLKLAFRNLKRNGLYSWINIIGLSVGLTTCILLALWLQNELTFDQFHKNADKIYRINADMGDMGCWPTTPGPLTPLALEGNPEVLEACRIAEYYTDFFEYNGQKFFGLSAGIAVDDNFFTFFDFKLIDGSVGRPFQDDLSLVLSESKAKILFGNENPVGKVIKSQDGLLFHVVGVVKDAPDNSSIQYDFIVPRLALQKTFRGNWIWKHIDDDWGNYRYQTFFLLHNNADPDALAKKISAQVTIALNAVWADDEDAEEESSVLILQPLKKLHLYEPDGSKSSDLKTLYLLAAIMVFILLIACINYVNIVTARAAKRSREIAMRKIMGANKQRLFFQLLLETVLLLVFSLAVASVLIFAFTPAYNTLAGKSLVFSFTNPVVLLVYAAMAISVIVLAGLYPAFSLMSFNPLTVFRNYVSGKKHESILRKGLVVLQFTISVVLIISTLTISQQIRFMRKKDLGYDKENIFTMRARNMSKHYDAVRNELLQNPQIADVTGGDLGNMIVGSSRGGTFWQGKPDDYDPKIYITGIQNNFIDFMNIKILEGEPLHSQDSFGLLINEEAKRIMKMENPIGQPFYMDKGDEKFYTIKGVVKDFNFAKLDKRIGPLIITNSQYGVLNIYAKVKPGGTKSAVETAEKLWKQYNPDYDFAYTFLEDSFDSFYKKEIYLERILLFFTIIAVFISCIGMFGLATYMAEIRTKEIGIRKTLGASITNIVEMLSKEFIILASIAVVIGIPVAFYIMEKMLQSYAYRISVTWWIILAALLIELILVIATVSAQALRAARANPVKAIKTE